MKAPAEIPGNVTLACPACGARYTTALPCITALCRADGHKVAAMRVVDDCDSSEHEHDDEGGEAA